MRLLPTSRTSLRGFTLIELMVVVVIIAVLAVLAVPQFVERFRQQRVLQAAHTVAETYRSARMRALGRGASVVVTMTPSTTLGAGTLQVLEGVEGSAAGIAAQRANCSDLPTRGCLTNNWGSTAAGGTARVLLTIPMPPDVATAALVGTTAVGDGTAKSICFSPGGRAYEHTAAPWTPASWAALNTTVSVNVTGARRTHTVLVLPNGTARLAL